MATDVALCVTLALVRSAAASAQLGRAAQPVHNQQRILNNGPKILRTWATLKGLSLRALRAGPNASTRRHPGWKTRSETAACPQRYLSLRSGMRALGCSLPRLTLGPSRRECSACEPALWHPLASAKAAQPLNLRSDDRAFVIKLFPRC